MFMGSRPHGAQSWGPRAQDTGSVPDHSCSNSTSLFPLDSNGHRKLKVPQQSMGIPCQTAFHHVFLLQRQAPPFMQWMGTERTALIFDFSFLNPNLEPFVKCGLRGLQTASWTHLLLPPTTPSPGQQHGVPQCRPDARADKGLPAPQPDDPSMRHTPWSPHPRHTVPFSISQTRSNSPPKLVRRGKFILKTDKSTVFVA